MIKVFDAYGREMYLTREDWRTKVLPGSIENGWNNPDQLYAIILQSLEDGFRQDVLKAAKHLFKTDPQRVRATCLWGIVLKEEGRLDEAERVFHDYIQKNGEDGVILTNLAKVHAERKEDSKVSEILWHALELDPNQENGLGWYWALVRETNGETAGTEALQRIASLPGSWRAQLWLARQSLESKNLEQALSLYQQALAHAPRPVPAALLMQISGDLGNHAHLPEILNVVEPLFDASLHGVQVGNNLIKAHVDLGQFDAAQNILDHLYVQKRPDWAPTLKYWDTEIAKSRVALSNATPISPASMGMVGIEGPIWLKPSSPPTAIFPVKSTKTPSVCILGATVGLATNSKRSEVQMADAPGRMSRALPLFLAEQVDFKSLAHVQTLFPWIEGEHQAFVISSQPWSPEEVSTYARQGSIKSDYVVITHLLTQQDPWKIELRLVRTIDAKLLASLDVSFSWEHPEYAIPDLARQLLSLLAQHAEVDIVTPPAAYQVPEASLFPHYLLRLEQLLAVRCATMDGASSSLNGERDIVDCNLLLCLDCPSNVPVRILLAQTLLTLKTVRPLIPSEYKDKIMRLQKEKSLAEPAHSILQRMFDEALGV